MSKTFILCEKPSQAMDFVKALSSKKNEKFDKNNGYFESSKYIICFARGHLVVPFMPEDYDERYKQWVMEDLPIIPNPVQYKVGEKDAEKLFKVISKQINRKDVDTIIVATDAEREGELIARLIINQSGVDTSNKNMYRFWTSAALTPDEIEKGLNNLKPLKEYDRYYRAAAARQKADYIVGLNATRAATLKGNGVISLGRVQTPVVNIVYMRDKEIENFKSETYFEISAVFNKNTDSYLGKLIDENNKNISFKTSAEAERILSIIQSNKIGKVLSVEKTVEKQKSPKLYSISTIQKEASSKAGISANNVLEILQKLYDEKYTTYPRTDSEVLSSSNVDLAKNVMNKLSKSSYSSFTTKCEVKADNKNVFDDSKLTDHHALIPTGSIPSDLSKDEQFIYDLICRRFLAVFSPDFVYEQTKVITEVNNYRFYSQGKTVKDLGWKALYQEKDNNILLPALSENDAVLLNKTEKEEKHTIPPSSYTDGSLIEAMSKAASFVKDENLKKILKDAKGIGTPATKASIIETALQRGYIERKGKQIKITGAGIKLIESMQGEQLLDPAYTALWEQELEKIASGEIVNITNFMKNIEDYVKYLVSSIAGKDLGGIAKGREPQQEGKQVGICPECGSPVIVYQKSKGYSCSNKECDFVLWKNKLAFLGRKEILTKDAKNILQAYQDKTTAAIDGLISKSSGKEYTGNVILEKDDKYGWGLKLVFDKK